MSLSYEQLEPDSQQVKKIVILSHGYGADCKDLMSIAEHWKRFLPDCLFVCPNAPTVCQINPSGYEWFDLMQTSQEKILEEFQVSLKKFIQFIEALLGKYNLEEKDIFLMGFSQGTKMSLKIALTCKTKIAGVLGYSGKIFNIPFLESMLSWKKGGVKEDGVWAAHWYENVHNSVGFKEHNSQGETSLTVKYNSLYKEASFYYDALKNI